jgi:hypothetical protein
MKQDRTSKAWQEYLDKYLSKPPKLRVIPLMDTKDEKIKAKLLQKILEWQWPVVEGRIRDEIYQPMMNCFLYGRHQWKKVKNGRHVCKICGFDAVEAYDPVFTGSLEVFFDDK